MILSSMTYNEDGIKDILAIGNLYNAEIETTRNDSRKWNTFNW